MFRGEAPVVGVYYFSRNVLFIFKLCTKVIKIMRKLFFYLRRMGVNAKSN
jgi:hypothetical protein